MMAFAAEDRPVLRIAAANVVTALGDDAHTSAAAWISQRRGQRLVQVGDARLYIAPAADITGESTGVQRIQRLLDAALRDLGPTLAKLGPADEQWPLECCLQLPVWLSEDQQQDLGAQTFTRLAAHTRGTLHVVHEPAPDASAAHRRLASMFQRLRAQALELGRQEAFSKRLLLIGVDSRCEPSQLHLAHALGHAGHTLDRRLDTAGEAAAYVLLAPEPGVGALLAGALALHPPACTAPADTPRWPGLQHGDGRSLQLAITQALRQAGLSLDRIGLMIDNNEDQPWRNEDQLAAIERLRHTEGMAWLAHNLGFAERLGQVGVATGVAHWALAHALHRHGLLPVSTALSVVQERSGACAAVVLERGK